MPPEHQPTIERVLTDVMEQMAFVFADPAEADELPAQLDDAVAVSLSFRGAASGSLELVTSASVCRELAVNLSGDDEAGDDPRLGRQALMELTNVICGQLLTAVAGPEPVFDLDPPRLGEGAEAWTRMRADDGVLGFLAEDQPLLLRFDYPQAQAPAQAA